MTKPTVSKAEERGCLVALIVFAVFALLAMATAFGLLIKLFHWAWS